jgi:glycosyltransferase involved in cell wall biosynthesis
MRVVLDNIVFSVQKIGGISVVWIELIKRILADKEIDATFIEFTSYHQNILRSQITVLPEKQNLISHHLITLKRFLNPKLGMSEKYIFHSSLYRISKDKKALNVLTIHDFLYFKKDWKGLYTWLIKKIHRYQFSNAINKADKIICISEFTKSELKKYFPLIKDSSIRIVYNGVSDEFFQVEQNCDLVPFVKNEFLLYVGSRSKYKNFTFTIKAAGALNMKLVIVGPPLNEFERKYVAEHMPSKNNVVLSSLSSQQLNLLFNSAKCLVYPSSYEGFGIPVIEAQKAGCPVIALRGSSITEIIGETPLLMPNLSIENFNSCLDLLNDKLTRDKIIIAGLQNSSRFSWDQNYNLLSEIYSELWHGH